MTDFGRHGGFSALPDEAAAPLRLSDRARTIAACLLLTVLLVSFNPFPSDIELGAGVLINRFGYASLACLVLLSHVLVTDPRLLRRLLSPWWLLFVLPLPISLLAAGLPADPVRGMLFTFVAMIVATGVLTLPPDARSFRTALIVAILVTLGLSYAGLIVLPMKAIHQAGEVESEHAGLWRGIYAHKNIAAPIMACFVFAGIYLMRSGARLAGIAILVGSLLFLAKTGSKTSLAIAPLIALLVLLGPILINRTATALAVFALVAGLLALTLGSVVYPVFGAAVQAALPGTTFTGRADLWNFALDLARDMPATGFGYQNFWHSDMVEFAEKPFELEWDMRGAAHAHNGYLDIALQFGWLCLPLFLFVILIKPLIDYVHAPADAETRALTDFFLMVLAFMLLNAALESFFFDREKQSWLLTWIAVLGLHLSRRLRIS